MQPVSRSFVHRTWQTAATGDPASQHAEAGPSATAGGVVPTRAEPVRSEDIDQRARNNDHLARYIVALQQAVRLDAGDGGKVLSAAAARIRQNMARRLINYMSQRGVDAERQTPEQLSRLKNDFLFGQLPAGLGDGTDDNSRASADSALQKYLDWRQNGLITVQQGVVIAVSERQQAVAQGNAQSLRDYRAALREEKNRAAGDGTTLISAAVAEERGVAASGYLQWMSINEHAVGELAPAAREARLEEYIEGRDAQRKRKRDADDRGETSSSGVLANQVGKYLDWLESGAVQKQRGVLTSRVEGSEDALAANRAFLQDYRAALKSAQSTPTVVIDKVISAKTAQNRGGSASRLISHLSEKGLNVRSLAPEAMSREIDELYRGIAGKSTADKFKSEVGKFLEWRNHSLRTGSDAASADFSEEQLARLESNTQHLDDYRAALREAATPAPGRAAGLIGENPRKNRGTSASAFVSWIKGNHALASLDEHEWHSLKNDYLQSRFALAEGAKPTSSWTSEESNLNKYIEWAMTDTVAAQKGGKAAPARDLPTQANTQRLSNYRNALATATQTAAGDGNTLISGFVQQSRAAAASSFLQWLSAKGTDSITLERDGLREAATEFLHQRYPDNAANREKLASNLRPFVEWQMDRTIKPQQGVDIVRDREIQATLEHNRFWLDRYHSSLTSAPADGSPALSASTLKNRKVQANVFTRYCSFEGRTLNWLSSHELESMSDDYLADKFAETRASARHYLRPYLDWLTAQRSADRARRDSTPGLFVSDDESIHG